MHLLKGLNDTMDIFAFKWNMFPGRVSKAVLTFGAAAIVFLIYLAASLGTFIKQAVVQLPDGDQGKETFLIFLKVFIDNSSGFMLGGMFWAMLLAALFMPLIGFSFGSIIPEGDLVSVKRNNNHKISDSIFLQIGSSISVVQIVAVTGLVSMFTVDRIAPGYAIVASWGLWVIASLFSSLSTWFFELLLRKFGTKSKMISLAVIASTVAALMLTVPTETLNFFGAAPMYIDFLNELSSVNILAFLAWTGAVGAVSVALLMLISFTASKALNLPEPPARKDSNVTFFARIGLEEKNFVGSTTQFITNTILQQPNILRPLLIGFFFTAAMSVTFYSFTQTLGSVASLIPVMVALAWTINVFGVFGSGTTWLLSLPKAKEALLSSVLKVHHFITLFIVACIGTAVVLIYSLPFSELYSFVLASMGGSLLIAQSSLKQSIYTPYRFRVNIKGESIIPPTKVISSLFRLFLYGFLASGAIYAAQVLPTYSMLAQTGVFLLIAIFSVMKYRKLQKEWMHNNEIVQNIIKSVGV